MRTLVMQQMRRARFARLTHRITGHSRFVCFAILSPKVADLNILLGIVPCPAHIVQKQRHQDAADRTEHEVAREHLCTQQGAIRVLTDEAKD